jgi:hypothetical protein
MCSFALLQTGATVQLSDAASRRPVQEAKATHSTGILMVQTVPCSELTTGLPRTCSTSRHQPKTMPFAFGFSQEARAIVADGHGRGIGVAIGAAHRHDD